MNASSEKKRNLTQKSQRGSVYSLNSFIPLSPAPYLARSYIQYKTHLFISSRRSQETVWLHSKKSPTKDNWVIRSRLNSADKWLLKLRVDQWMFNRPLDIYSTISRYLKDMFSFKYAEFFLNFFVKQTTTIPTLWLRIFILNKLQKTVYLYWL